MKARTLALVLAATLPLWSVAACDDGERPHASPSSGTSSAPASTASSPPTNSGDLSVADAEPARAGVDITIIGSFSEKSPSGASQVTAAGLEDGRLVLAVAPPPDVTSDDVTIRPARLGLLDPALGRIDLITTGKYAGASRQITAADVNLQWLVWSESSSTDLFSDPWHLYAYNLRTQHSHEIAQAQPNQDGQYPTVRNGLHARVADNGRVYFAAPAGTEPNAPPAVYSVALEGNAKPRLEAKNAWSPAAAGTHLNYLTPRGVRSRPLSSTGPGDPTVIEPKTGCKDVELGANGPTLVVVRRCGKNAQVLVSDGTARGIIIIDANPGPVVYLRVTSDYVGFATGTGPYKQFLLRLRDHKLLAIGSGSLAGDMPGAGSTFSWTSYAHPRSPGVEHVARLH